MPATPLILCTDRVKATAHKWIDMAPPETIVTFNSEPTRTQLQNARFWAMLGDVSRQVELFGRRATADVWKARFMNACGHEVQFEQGLSGEPFPVGFRSSNLSVSQMCDLQEYMAAYGAEQGVIFNDGPEAPENR